MTPAAPVSTPKLPRQHSRGVPVGLNEAVYDSPTFRATAAHFTEQVEAVEKWLNGYVSSTSKLAHEIQGLEDTVNNYLIKTMLSAVDGIIENDYTLLALKRVGDAQRERWMQILASTKRMDDTVIEPIRTFLSGDMRNFKEVRRNLEATQRAYDSNLARYVGQSKTKEPSALREDAFFVYENRKAYVHASLAYCQLAPQLRFAIDKLLVKVCSEIWEDLLRSRDAVSNAARWTREMERVQGWAREMESLEGIFRTELESARKRLGELTLESLKPSRELEDYSASTVPFLGSRGPLNLRPKHDGTAISEKQGWLFLRIMHGKPVKFTWVRRWYYCHNGVFGWLVSGPQGVLQGDEIGVLLCNTKPAVSEERRFCFEVKTKNQTMMLQAENQRELIEWLEVFDVTKKKAFETSMGNSNSSVAGGGTDAAFFIHPPSAPEFSARSADNPAALSIITGVDDTSSALERNATLYVPGQDGSRHSVDVNYGTTGRRSFSALGRDLAREDDESRREHAARILQKLDLHRKATLSASAIDLGPSSPALPSSSIAGIISTGQNLLPTSPGTQTPGGTLKQSISSLPSLDAPRGSLAPSTLAKPPATTSLSRSAVLLMAERRSGSREKLPTSILANYWGSNVWAMVHPPEQPVLPRHDDDDPIGVVVSQGSQTSLTGAEAGNQDRPLPLNYPPELRAQNAQFWLLFPNALPGENPVLVFRAAWSSTKARGDSSNETLAGDGRIYLTPDNMYFYSQQMGLVTAYSMNLDIITEVTTASGRDCDCIFLHLGQDTNDTGYTRITIKIFLDDLQILHTRLNLLIDNLQAEEPMDARDIIEALTSVEKEEFERPSAGAESWEEISANIPIDDNTASGKPTGHSQQDFGLHLQPSRSHQPLPGKLHLPSQPVIYEPESMTQMAAERHFEISAKACFHVLFGDRSFVFPKLYFEHRAQQIAQGPWVLVDEGKMRRDFHFKVDYVDMLGRKKSANVKDYQTIDVYNDHVMYVVTHIKTAWHLPHSQSFKLVTKIAITHVAKSKCKLAAYVKIDWSKTPALSKNMVERQALHDAITDAEEMAELATDQVHKLGPRSRTNRAIQVYGHVGQQTQVVIFSPASAESSKKQAIKPRTLTAMLFDTVRSFGDSAVSSLIMWAFAGLKKLFSIITAHRVIIVLLAASTLANLLLTSTESSTWWKERKAARFMRRVGVTPNPTMSKAIYIADLDEATGSNGHDLSFPRNSPCFSMYKNLLNTTEMDAPWEEAGATFSSHTSRATARRLRRTRQRLGSYRHDLMVAMRVVNSIEREMLQSEWENWLMNEKSLCDDLELMLQDGGRDIALKEKSSAQRLVGSLSGNRRKALEQWRDEYCGSCRRDFDVIIKERIVTGL